MEPQKSSGYGTGMEVHLLSPGSGSSGLETPGALVGGMEGLVRLLSLVCENVYSGTIICDHQSHIRYINRFYANLLGIDSKEAVGRKIQDYFPSSRVPVVLDTGRGEMGARCTLRAEIDYVINRIPVKSEGKTVGVILQTVFKNFTEVNDLMKRLRKLEERVVEYKKGLDSMLSATYSFDSILGWGDRILEAKALAEKYARTDGAVLILGPTGTGKELFAHAIHLASPRSSRPFVCLNCAAIPKDLLESELFGYEQGAFTGAKQKGKAGKIELAHKGTLFLDEIGDLPTNAQAKILRVLENKQVEKLGGVKGTHVDFRLIAATNRDLTEMMGKGEFREDLYYRLNTMTIHLPFLSERSEDIPGLVKYFLRDTHHPDVEVSDAALQTLMSYSWPGNVRELKNVIERAASLIEGHALEEHHLPEMVRQTARVSTRVAGGTIRPLAEELACFEKETLSQALAATNRNMAKTAKLLCISRSTLYEKCRLHNL
jgi:transcriptional regulator with PAS, ATPase and Fis domain